LCVFVICFRSCSKTSLIFLIAYSSATVGEGVNILEIFMAILIGIGLSASAGFRVFTRLLITSLAAKASWVTLSTNFEWISSTPALIAFAVATILEICIYYIPIVDSFMKTIATPVAVIAGTILTASFIADLDPFLTWSISVIGGGGVASVTQMTSLAVRGTSTVVTGGIGNILVSIVEGIIAFVMSVLTILLPFVVIIFVGIILFIFIKGTHLLKRRKSVIKSGVM